eukprot:6146915-Prymnesium_polylepis.1
MRVRQVVVSTGVTTTLAGSGTSSSTDGTGTSAAFYYPHGVAVSPDGLNLFVADWKTHCIRQVRDGRARIVALLLQLAAVVHVLALAHTPSRRDHSKRVPISAAFKAASATLGGVCRCAGRVGLRGETRCVWWGRVRVRSRRCTVQVEDRSYACVGLTQPRGSSVVALRVHQVVVSTGVTTTLAGSCSTSSGSADGTGTSA